MHTHNYMSIFPTSLLPKILCCGRLISYVCPVCDFRENLNIVPLVNNVGNLCLHTKHVGK